MQRRKKENRTFKNCEIISRYNMHIWNTRRRENKVEEIFEVIMAEKFPKLITNPKLQVYEAQRTPNEYK